MNFVVVLAMPYVADFADVVAEIVADTDVVVADFPDSTWIFEQLFVVVRIGGIHCELSWTTLSSLLVPQSRCRRSWNCNFVVVDVVVDDSCKTRMKTFKIQILNYDFGCSETKILLVTVEIFDTIV